MTIYKKLYQYFFPRFLQLFNNIFQHFYNFYFKITILQFQNCFIFLPLFLFIFFYLLVKKK